MEEVDKEYEDFDFSVQNAPRIQSSQLNRLVSRIEEASRSQEEDSHSQSAPSKQFQTDKKGNFRYFSDEDEDDLSEEEDSYEEQKKSPAG